LRVFASGSGGRSSSACYGQGGTAPTITDANVVLGRLAPEQFLGGKMRLDRQAALEALRQHITVPLDVDLERAASSMLEVAVAAMAIRCGM
jgi:N-methylhydantoinase A